MGRYTPGWITVPGKGRRWRTSEGEYMMQRPAGDAIMGALQGAWSRADRALGGWLSGGGTPNAATRRTPPPPASSAAVAQRPWAGRPGQFSDKLQPQNALDAINKAGASPLGVIQGKKNDLELIKRFYSQPENSAVANQYDLTTNMMMRYLSGAGARGLEVSPQQGRAILGSIRESQSIFAPGSGPRSEAAIDAVRSNYGQGSVNRLRSGDVPVYFGGVADTVAPVPATIRFDRDGRGELKNSLGSFWAEPTQGGGYRVDERYDFMYAPQAKGGKYDDRVIRQVVSDNRFDFTPNNIGRRLVMQGYGQPYSYSLDIAPDGTTRVTPR